MGCKTTISFLRGCCTVACCLTFLRLAAQDADKTRTLDSITVTGNRKELPYRSAVPQQVLGKELLDKIQPASAADAAKYFSGVLVKDYGGLGGLKTVSVRNLGAAQTGVLYDGVPVADMQTGQVDLGKYSAAFLDRLSLTEASLPPVLQPARSLASAAVLSLESVFFRPDTLQSPLWNASLEGGSFGWWKPGAAYAGKLGSASHIGLQAEYNRSEGDYPYTVNNGNQSKELKRNNADIESFQAALHLHNRFRDSSALNTRVSWYGSDRGLPGAVIFFNENSSQRLRDHQFNIQSRYRTGFGTKTTAAFIARYQYNYTRYQDPDYLNNAGFLDNRYKLQEAYVSGAVTQKLTSDLLFSWSSDLAYTTLYGDMANFSNPYRWSLWNAASLGYSRSSFNIQGTILHSYMNDEARNGAAAGDRSAFSPTLAVSWYPGRQRVLLVRAFYKNVFRMPSFNDLYYTLVGNRNLKPEYAHQYNLGATFTRQTGGWIGYLMASADGYYNRVTDKILAVPNKNLFVWSMMNVGKVNIWGLDLNLETGGTISPVASWLARLAGTVQEARNYTDPSSSGYRHLLPYTPVTSGSFLLQGNWKSWSASWAVLYSGSRYTLGDNDPANRMDAWHTQDLSFFKYFNTATTRIHIVLQLKNLFDARYDVIKNYPMPGRNFSCTIQIHPLK